ncbi:S1/P1 nuclease [Leptospira kirschneri]|uniref:S1/P1 Nuclease n=1 Tax=Leptospira kirschneri serovar Bulgarica str. Nikolaevo TaxID=1240687 RepID=M6EZN7_9LEPT|nr:S1/P1 nuclease [Leptospira kirschneri]EKO62103.1 S1/P1 Nuclease [Leptospira kirschneri str. H2]EMK21540.1 S1/P1 Nuclease [Leptospira kirschneri serovar Bulgarica str. Nikolaevo]
MKKVFFRIKFLIFVIIFLLYNSNVYAWGWEGHRAIGIIAQQLLINSKKFDPINDILGDLTLEQISTCPDELKAFQSQKREMSPVCSQVFTSPAPPTNTGPWHFIDIPVSLTNPIHDDIEKICKSTCVVAEIDKWSSVLADTTQTKAKRLQALSFVVHFIGDLHQPLHTAERNNDLGGNRVSVQIGKRKTNLHSMWDTSLVNYISTNPVTVTIILKSDIAFAQMETQMNPEAWTFQSFHFARNVAYDGIPIGRSITKISDAYIQNALPVVKHQLANAGVRLARHLEKLFSKYNTNE